MGDTTQIEIISKQLDKIATAVTTHPTGMSSGQIALFAAAIGATAAILDISHHSLPIISEDSLPIISRQSLPVSVV